MKIEIYVWDNAPTYSHEKWKAEGKTKLEIDVVLQILFNHHLKEYRKNFKCTSTQLTTLIEKSKTIRAGNTETLTI